MRAVVFDTETTGLVDRPVAPIDGQPEVIEFHGCLVELDAGVVVSELGCLIKPKKKLSDKVTEITGITDEMLAGERSFADVSDEIISFIESAPLAISHNLSYDKAVMDFEASRVGRTIKWRGLLCTVEQTIHSRGFRLSLTALHEYLFGVPFADAHRAKEDVTALVRCAIELRMRGDI